MPCAEKLMKLEIAVNNIISRMDNNNPEIVVFKLIKDLIKDYENMGHKHCELKDYIEFVKDKSYLDKDYILHNIEKLLQ